MTSGQVQKRAVWLLPPSPLRGAVEEEGDWNQLVSAWIWTEIGPVRNPRASLQLSPQSEMPMIWDEIFCLMSFLPTKYVTHLELCVSRGTASWSRSRYRLCSIVFYPQTSHGQVKYDTVMKILVPTFLPSILKAGHEKASLDKPSLGCTLGVLVRWLFVPAVPPIGGSGICILVT